MGGKVTASLASLLLSLLTVQAYMVNEDPETFGLSSYSYDRLPFKLLAPSIVSQSNILDNDVHSAATEFSSHDFPDDNFDISSDHFQNNNNMDGLKITYPIDEPLKYPDSFKTVSTETMNEEFSPGDDEEISKILSSLKVDENNMETSSSNNYDYVNGALQARSYDIGHGHGYGHKHGEVHYHKHEHMHKHDHKQEHEHKHQQEHKHDHHHGHKHGHHHGHKHEHGHKHDNHHKHDHHHGHKHEHHNEHKHDHHHGHKHDHKHGHKHDNHHGHKHDHHHDHHQDHHHSHDHHQDHKHDHHHDHGHHHKHGNKHHHGHHHSHKHQKHGH